MDAETMATTDPLRLRVDVRPEDGLLPRRIFTDQDVHELEMTRVFARSWLMVTHASAIPGPGDHVTTTMGEDPVIVVRQRDGSIAVLLNTCRHRGMRVCRTDSGRARAFTCSYHGWSYGLGGELRQVPLSTADDERRRGRPGLLRARAEVYGGLVFATFDPDLPPLREYLGDMAWYLDAFVDRRSGGSEVIGGVHRWVLDGNWKLGAEQFASDSYHAASSHLSAITVLAEDLPPERRAAAAGARQEGYQYSGPRGHAIGFTVGDGIDGAAREMLRGPVVHAYTVEHGDEMVERLGKARATGPVAGHATVFPNFSYLAGGASTLRVWHPRGPHRMEVHAWVLVDADAPPEVKRAQRLAAVRTFSPAGIIEQDDGENWAEIQRTFRGGAVQRAVELDYRMGVGSPATVDPDYPGEHGPFLSEHAARGFYRAWLDLMTCP